MMPPSERAIALFLSQTSSTRNRALLYLTITDGNADHAVALFNSKPDESFRAALSRPAAQFRRPLANEARGYEDKYGVIHLETSTDNENEDEAEGRIVAKATTKVGRRNRGAAARDSTYEPEEISTPLDQSSRTGRGKLPRLRNRGRHGRYARELGAPGVKSLGGADNAKSISDRKRKSLKRVERLPSKSQGPRLRPRNNLPTYGSPKKGVVDVTPPPPKTRRQHFFIPVPPTRRSVQRQSSEEYEQYVTLSSSAQSRFKQTKKNTSGIANPSTPRTGLSSNPSGTDSYPTPFSLSTSRLDTGRMTPNTGNPQDPSEEILHSSFHRSSFESMSPLAMRSDYYNEGKTHCHQRDASEIPLQVLYNSNKTKKHRHYHHHQRDTSEMPLKDMYLSPPSLSRFSFRSALNLAREKRKWLLINLQSATVPACGILNREIWRHPDIRDTVSQSFIFLQLDHNDERADAYLEKFYGDFDLDEEEEEDKKEGEGMEYAAQGKNHRLIQLPHIALLDPISGERWKVWNGPGVPDKDLFLADLSEYEMVGEGGWCEWGKGVIGGMD